MLQLRRRVRGAGRTSRGPTGQGGHDLLPNGHMLSWATSEGDKLRAQVESERKRTEWWQEEARQARERAEHEERRARALRGHATRLRKRIAEGKCPCCSKAFPDMAAHIAEKHPRYVPTEET